MCALTDRLCISAAVNILGFGFGMMQQRLLGCAAAIVADAAPVMRKVTLMQFVSHHADSLQLG